MSNKKVLNSCKMESGGRKAFSCRLSAFPFTLSICFHLLLHFLFIILLQIKTWSDLCTCSCSPGAGRGVQGENFSRAAWAELRMGLLELKIPSLPFLCPVWAFIWGYFVLSLFTQLTLMLCPHRNLFWGKVQQNFSREMHSKIRVLWSARN